MTLFGRSLGLFLRDLFFQPGCFHGEQLRVEVVVPLYKRLLFLLLNGLVDEEFFLAFGLALFEDSLTVCVELIFAVLDHVGGFLFS